MKIRYLALLVFCMLIFPLNVSATCDDQRLAELSKMASNVRFSYVYDLDENGDVQFDIVVSNITQDIYVVDMFGNEYREFESVAPFDSRNFHIFSNDSDCGGKLLSRSVKVPGFNEYSKLKECENNSNVLCDFWQDTTAYDEEEFKKIITSESISQNTNVVSEKSETEEIDYKIFIVIGFLLFVMVIVLLLKKKFFRKDGRKI